MLLYRKLEVIQDHPRNPSTIAGILMASSAYYIIAPYLLLLGWFILILFDLSQEGQPILPAIALLLLGIAFILFGFNVMKIVWGKFQFTSTNVYLVLLVVILVTVYQALMIFGYEYWDMFIAYSAFFLNLNAMVMAVVVFLDRYEDTKDLMTEMKKYFPMLAEGEGVNAPR